MKKTLKMISGILLVVVACFFMFNVFADDKPEVVKYVNGNYSAVLYSDNQFYLWGGSNKLKYKATDVIDFSFRDSYGYLINLVDINGNLKILHEKYVYDDESSSDYYDFELIDTKRSNVKNVEEKAFLTNDDKLYKYSYINYDNVGYVYEEELLLENVKEWSYYNNSYLILDKNNKLYAYGTNVFGKKINDGNDIVDEPVLIAENVKEFSNTVNEYAGYNSISKSLLGNFYLTKDNELYIMSNKLAYPKLIQTNVSKYLFDYFYIKDGKTYRINKEIKDDYVEIEENLILSESLSENSGYYSTWFLTDSGNLYDSNYDLVLTNVKQIDDASDEFSNVYYVLMENGDLYSIEKRYNDYRSDYDLIKLKVLSNVKEMLDSEHLIMEDETIYVKNRSSAYYDIADFNSTETVYHKNFSVIKGLPNVSEELVATEVVLNNTGKTDFVEGNTYDFYSYVYPSNVVNKDVIWESSDESVATVNEKGTLTFVAPGKTTIKVKHKTLNLSDEVEITVYPKNTGIEITNGDEITVNVGKPMVLKAKITPENILEQKLSWTTDAGKDEDDINIISFYDHEYGYEGADPEGYNEIGFTARKPGKYTITVTTEDGLYSDTIIVNVIQGITSFGFDVNSNNLLGQTLYIYMSESKELDLNVVVYPANASDKEIIYTSSNENIATVDETGKVTAKKSGKVTIKVKAKNYNVERDINILIFGNDVTTKIGDVDGDGVVDILDLVKLRRHVAGVEALQ